MNLYPIALSGDIIALNNAPSKTLIYNWKTGACAYLDEGGDLRRNPCLEVVFTPSIILVVRTARILHQHLHFPAPPPRTNPHPNCHTLGHWRQRALPSTQQSSLHPHLLRGIQPPCSDTQIARILLPLLLYPSPGPHQQNILRLSTTHPRQACHRSMCPQMGKLGRLFLQITNSCRISRSAQSHGPCPCSRGMHLQQTVVRFGL